MISGDSPNKAA